MFGRRSKGVIDYRKGGAIRILRLPGQPAVCDDACNGCIQRGTATLKKRNHIVVGLAHLSSVEPWQNLKGGAAGGLRHDEKGFVGRTVEVVEAAGSITSHFQMLELIVTDGDLIGIEHQNVSRHQYGVGKEAHRDVSVRVATGSRSGIDRSLIGVCAVE